MRAALAAVDAQRLVTHALTARDLDRFPAFRLIAAGKAAGAMATAATRLLGGRARDGLVIAPDPVAVPESLQLVVAGHPAPDHESEKAGRQALALARSGSSDECLLVLLSGGASALMAVPADGVSLEEKARTATLLMRRGADIYDLNTVRKHLSGIKGGQLAAAATGMSWTLAISDVVDDDLGVIGSGPTVADRTTFADALAVLERRGGVSDHPPSIVERLERGARGDLAESPKPGDPRLRRASAWVIGGRREAMQGAAEKARALGYHPVIREDAIVGESWRAAVAHLEWVVEHGDLAPRPLAIISSGETTVHVRGHGRGGRNQEFALAAAPRLSPFGAQAVLASVGTDGVDGPTDAAGAIADPTTIARGVRSGLPTSETFLADNDSYTFFHALGDLVRTGPTGTNVGDLQVLLVR